ncbi:MAG: ABC-type transport auxiliary lipoprotein family protein [Syntrophobacterales bacterium]|jgi:cholesterol transport system auxiliary component|nr:ABC-type transport auxiliary lipoprotein family protein [Syntrophobacterales bacterium]
MRNYHMTKANRRVAPVLAQILFLGILCLFGCLPGNKPPQLTEQYAIEYAPPAVYNNGTPLPYTIRIERFSAAQAYNNQSMTYRPEPYKLASYDYHRWRVMPGDMVTDHFVRDLRNSGMFAGVFSYRESESTRFVLEGGVEEFLEVDEQREGRAVLCLNVALIDTTQTEITKRLIFQKKYRHEEPIKEQTPVSLTQGMSASMKRLSDEIMRDIYASIHRLSK